MPRGPKGEKRPADVIGAAVMVGKIATGEIEDNPRVTPWERHFFSSSSFFLRMTDFLVSEANGRSIMQRLPLGAS
jgi:hypothetical protein